MPHITSFEYKTNVALFFLIIVQRRDHAQKPRETLNRPTNTLNDSIIRFKKKLCAKEKSHYDERPKTRLPYRFHVLNRTNSVSHKLQ